MSCYSDLKYTFCTIASKCKTYLTREVSWSWIHILCRSCIFRHHVAVPFPHLFPGINLNKKAVFKLWSDSDLWSSLSFTAFFVWLYIYVYMLSNVFQKNIRGALMVLKQMEHEDVKPDSQTFSYLIGNCESEEDITKVVCNFVVCSKLDRKSVV